MVTMPFIVTIHYSVSKSQEQTGVGIERLWPCNVHCLSTAESIVWAVCICHQGSWFTCAAEIDFFLPVVCCRVCRVRVPNCQSATIWIQWPRRILVAARYIVCTAPHWYQSANAASLPFLVCFYVPHQMDMPCSLPAWVRTLSQQLHEVDGLLDPKSSICTSIYRDCCLQWKILGLKSLYEVGGSRKAYSNSSLFTLG